MKRLLALSLLALLLPISAWASGIDLVSRHGSISISTAGIMSTGSQLTSFGNVTASPGHSLGSVTFSTGALTSGSVAGGGTFSSVGSSFVVMGKGSEAPHKGVIFSGSFVGDVTWTLVSHNGQSLVYQLTGTIMGTLWNGKVVTGTTTQIIYSADGQINAGVGHIRMGDTNLPVPEPGTLGLLGTGLLGVAGMIRRKLTARTT